MRIRFVACAAAVLLIAGGCSKQETAEPAATESTATATTASEAASAPADTAAGNPCSWVPVEEVSAIAGTTVTANPGDTENDCSFRSTDDKIKFVVKRWTTAEGYDAVAAMKGAEPVSGVGEKAVWIPFSHSLSAVKNGQVLDVSYDRDPSVKKDPAAEKAQCTALAQKLIERL